jgi:hypothetical protein
LISKSTKEIFNMNKTFAFKTMMLLSLVGSTSGIIPNAVQAGNDEDPDGNRHAQHRGPDNRDAEEALAARQAQIRAAEEALAARQVQIRALETAVAIVKGKKGKK